LWSHAEVLSVHIRRCHVGHLCVLYAVCLLMLQTNAQTTTPHSEQCSWPPYSGL